MAEKIQAIALKDTVGIPQFDNVSGLRTYLVSILDVCDSKNKLDYQGLFSKNKGRKISLSTGNKQGSFIRQIIISESKAKDNIVIGFGNRCIEKNQKDKFFMVEQYGIVGEITGDPAEDILFFTHKDNCSNEQGTVLTNQDKIQIELSKIKEQLKFAVNINCI